MLDQSVLRKLLSRYEIVECGIPNCIHTCSNEEFGSGFCCDTLLVGCQNGHLRESVDDHENTLISLFGGRKAQHVIHGDGFPGPARSR